MRLANGTKFILCAGLVTLTAACSEASPVDEGKQALESRCSRCHAIGEAGTSPRPDAPPFRDIVKRYPPEDLAESLAEGITSGHPDMPQFVLAPEEIGDVIDYLRTLMPNR